MYIHIAYATNTLSLYKVTTMNYGKLSLRYEAANIWNKLSPSVINVYLWMILRTVPALRLGRARCACVGRVCYVPSGCNIWPDDLICIL